MPVAGRAYSTYGLGLGVTLAYNDRHFIIAQGEIINAQSLGLVKFQVPRPQGLQYVTKRCAQMLFTTVIKTLYFNIQNHNLRIPITCQPHIPVTYETHTYILF